MKKSLTLLIGLLLIVNFVFVAADTNPANNVDPKNVANEVIKNLKENLTSQNQTLSQIGTELPNFLKFIYDVNTIEGLIIYAAFFVMIFILIYGVVEIFSNKKGVRGIIAGATTILIAITGSIQKIINSYLSVDIMNLDYKAISWKIVGIAAGVLVVLTLLKWILHKMRLDAEKDNLWGKGFKIWSSIKKEKTLD